MISTVERARTSMDTTRDHRDRIAAATQVDRQFATYEIEMGPDEALSFAATAPSEKRTSEALYTLIDAINHTVPPANFGPNHPRTGTAHHQFRIGRHDGERVLILQIFRGYFEPDFPIDELTDALAEHGTKAGVSGEMEDDGTNIRFTFRWAAEKSR